MNTRPLSTLQVGERARVVRLCAGESMRRRLLDLGLVCGTEVRCLQRSPAGDPTAYLIRGAVIALRRRDSACVMVREERSWG